jgi:hypothetical protein
MNTRELRIAAGAGDPDPTPARTTDVLIAVSAFVAAIESQGLTVVEYSAEVEKAADEVYRTGRAYLDAREGRKR